MSILFPELILRKGHTTEDPDMEQCILRYNGAETFILEEIFFFFAEFYRELKLDKSLLLIINRTLMVDYSILNITWHLFKLIVLPVDMVVSSMRDTTHTKKQDLLWSR